LLGETNHEHVHLAQSELRMQKTRKNWLRYNKTFSFLENAALLTHSLFYLPFEILHKDIAQSIANLSYK